MAEETDWERALNDVEAALVEERQAIEDDEMYDSKAGITLACFSRFLEERAPDIAGAHRKAEIIRDVEAGSPSEKAWESLLADLAKLAGIGHTTFKDCTFYENRTPINGFSFRDSGRTAQEAAAREIPETKSKQGGRRIALSAALRTALQLSTALGVTLTVVADQPWQSATFSGQRVRLRADQPLPADLQTDTLDARIPGSLIADITIDGTDIDVLLVHEA